MLTLFIFYRLLKWISNSGLSDDEIRLGYSAYMWRDTEKSIKEWDYWADE